MLGRTIEHCECPNKDLSLKRGTIEGTYVEDGRLLLVVLFGDGKMTICAADYVTVLEARLEGTDGN
jgi:hypothetical protein